MDALMTWAKENYNLLSLLVGLVGVVIGVVVSVEPLHGELVSAIGDVLQGLENIKIVVPYFGTKVAISIGAGFPSYTKRAPLPFALVIIAVETRIGNEKSCILGRGGCGIQQFGEQLCMGEQLPMSSITAAIR